MAIVIVHLLFRIIDIPFLCYHSSHPYPMSCIPYSLISHTTTTPSLHCGFQTRNKCSKRRVLDEKNWANFIDDYPGSSFLCYVVTAITVLFVMGTLDISNAVYTGGASFQYVLVHERLLLVLHHVKQSSSVGSLIVSRYSRHSNAVYTGGGFLTVRPFQISTVGPSSLGFVLSTSHAVVWY